MAIGRGYDGVQLVVGDQVFDRDERVIRYPRRAEVCQRMSASENKVVKKKYRRARKAR